MSLERGYARLLRAYPAGYRRDEMLDTLLQAARPGQARPAAREALGLVTGGLRVRAGVTGRRPFADTVRVGLVYAGLLSLAKDAASVIAFGGQWSTVVQLVLPAVAALLVWLRIPRWVLVPWVLAVAFAVMVGGGLVDTLPYLVIALAGRRADGRPAALFAVVFAVFTGITVAGDLGDPLAAGVACVVLLLAYGSLDPRVAFGLAGLVLLRLAGTAAAPAVIVPPGYEGVLTIALLLVVPVLIGTAIGVRDGRTQARP